MSAPRPVLAFDFGSPTASAALASAGELLGERAAARDGEADLLRLIAELLAEAAVAPRELAGVVALAGPGSFTGVRVACATAVALAQAWPLRAGGVSTLEALCWSAPRSARRILAVVDALRGEWFLQEFGAIEGDRTRPARGEARLWRSGDGLPTGIELVVGCDAERFAAAAGFAGPVLAPRPLAPPVARAASLPGWAWREEPLSRPFHLRPPATTGPSR